MRVTHPNVGHAVSQLWSRSEELLRGGSGHPAAVIQHARDRTGEIEDTIALGTGCVQRPSDCAYKAPGEDHPVVDMRIAAASDDETGAHVTESRIPRVQVPTVRQTSSRRKRDRTERMSVSSGDTVVLRQLGPMGTNPCRGN